MLVVSWSRVSCVVSCVMLNRVVMCCGLVCDLILYHVGFGLGLGYTFTRFLLLTLDFSNPHFCKKTSNCKRQDSREDKTQNQFHTKTEDVRRALE